MHVLTVFTNVTHSSGHDNVTKCDIMFILTSSILENVSSVSPPCGLDKPEIVR